MSKIIWQILRLPILGLMSLLGLLIFVVVKSVEPETKFADFWEGK